MSAPLKPDLVVSQRLLGRLAVTSSSLRAYRAGVLDLLRPLAPFDAAVFHALSPRVPLETGVFVGLPIEMVTGSRAHWDDFAVELGAMRDLANAHLVVSDREAFPPGTRGRKRFERHFVRRFGMQSLAMMHLVVRGATRAAVALLARRRNAFGPTILGALRELAPAIAIADTMHASLDGTPTAASPIRFVCRDQRLTPRQREIVEHVAMGQTNEAIGRALDISPNTARNQLAKVFLRVGASNRADLVRLAVLVPGR